MSASLNDRYWIVELMFLMPQRLLRPEYVRAQSFIDPVREGFPHAVRGDLAGQFVRFDDSFQDSMILDPAQRPLPLRLGKT